MTLGIVSLPIDYFPDPNRGRPIYNGQIFVGEPDLDPEILANRKAIVARQEDGTDIPISPAQQPVRTSSGGVPTYNGATVQILVEGNYSIKVLDRAGVQEYYWPNVYDGQPLIFGETSFVYSFETLDAALNDSVIVEGSAVDLRERILGGGGGALWDLVLTSSVTPNGFNIVQSIASPTLSLVLRVDTTITYRQLGGLSDGSNEGPLIELLFSLAGDVYIDDATITMDTPAILSSDTTVTCHPNAVFRRGDVPVSRMFLGAEPSNVLGGYKALNNVTFINGNFDFNNTNGQVGSVMSLGHAENISFVNCKFTNGTGHYFEIGGCRNISYKNCIFGGMSQQDQNFTEAVQLENMDRAAGFPSFGPYDNTISQDIFLNDCVLEPRRDGNNEYINGTSFPVMVGQHSSGSPNPVKNLVVDGCTFIAPLRCGVRLLGVSKARISNCFAENGPLIQLSAGIGDQGSKDVLISNNEVTNSAEASTLSVGIDILNTSLDIGKISSVVIDGNKINSQDGSVSIDDGIKINGPVVDMSISNNIITGIEDGIDCSDSNNSSIIITGNIIKDTTQSGVDFDGCDKLLITSNIFENTSEAAIAVTDCSSVIVTSNAFKNCQKSAFDQISGGNCAIVSCNVIDGWGLILAGAFAGLRARSLVSVFNDNVFVNAGVSATRAIFSSEIGTFCRSFNNFGDAGSIEFEGGTDNSLNRAIRITSPDSTKFDITVDDLGVITATSTTDP